MDKYLNIEKTLLHWAELFMDYLPRVFLALVAFLFFRFLGKLFRKHSVRLASKIAGGRSDFSRLLSSIIYALFLIAGLFVALEILQLEGVLAKILAGAGVVGIIAGFAFKDIASNAFAGLLVNMQRPYKEGDWVNLNGQFGTIDKIGWIATSVKTVTGQEAFVPNQLVYNNVLLNYSTYGRRRVVLEGGVSYGDDLDHVKQVALDEIKKVKGIRNDQEIEFYYTNIGSSTYDFMLRFWIDFRHQTDYLESKSDTIMRIKKRFEQEDISLAYSVMTLDFGVKGGVNVFDQALKVEK